MTNTFSILARYKINIKKSVASPYTNIKDAEEEIWETMIDKCHIHKNRMTLTKTVKDFSNTGKKLKEILEYANMSHAHIGRINIIKMAILPNTIYIFNITSIKILMPFLTEIEKKKTLKFIWKHRHP